MILRALCQLTNNFIRPVTRSHLYTNRVQNNNCLRHGERYKSTGPNINNRKKAAEAEEQHRIRTITYYCTSVVVLVTGLTYAAVPLYRMFCQVCFTVLNTRFEMIKWGQLINICIVVNGLWWND